MSNLNTHYNRRGKNVVLECLQFGGNSEFWKRRGGLTSYSDLQEEFYQQISKQYGAKRGVSLSLIKKHKPSTGK
ncbi:MAG: hypothetical protein K2O81_00020 [Clostridia bacterium]|nr:hypothetical protein [Clostridia bacterium]